MIFDVESDGLLDEATKIHVLAYKDGGEVKYTHDYDEMRSLLTNAEVLIGHNIIRYDIPLVEKILGIKVKARLIDTLALAWYLDHDRTRYGLEHYGEDFGVPKPVINDWSSLTPEEYAHRCVEDVKINSLLWDKLWNKLLVIYGDESGANRLINYLSFKLDCIREQERSKWKLDVERARTTLARLKRERDEKISQLKEVMPPVKEYVTKTRPAKPFKKDGTYSVAGAKWFKLLRDHGLPEDYEGSIEVLHSTKEPNPASTQQIKDWPFSFGWVPSSYKYVREEDGSERSIPQVRIDGKDGKELCPSVKKLIDKHPSIKLLEGLTVLNHRIGVLEGFLRNERNGYLEATVSGLTNTLRWKHKVLVNLPGVHRPYGEDIRGCLIAPEGYELCGSDMCSLEETTKKHYMSFYDPEFVAEMSKEGFDAHLDLAKHAGAVTQEQIEAHKRGEIDLGPIRKVYKAANYACVYGVGASKLARETGLSQSDAKKLIEKYWERNWSVKKLAEDTKVKRIGDEMWLFNPVSKLWYNLRNEKDIFSTLNQGTGVFCFDSWIREWRKVRPQLTGQFHDEIILTIKKGSRDKCTKMLKDAISRVNDKLKLNVKLDIDVQYGSNYAEIH